MSGNPRRLIRSALVLSPVAYGFARYLKSRQQELFRRTHDSDFKALRALGLPRDALILDIGANNGQAARSIFSVLPTSSVVSFEPNPMHWESLKRIQGGRGNYSYFGCALSDVESTMWLYWPVYNGCEFSPLASLDEKAASTWLNEKTLIGFRSEKLEVRRAMVEVKTLDSFQLNPNFIKLDVEGVSLGVLRGAQDTLKRTTPILLIEEVKLGDEVDVFLKQLDYLPFARNPNTGILEALSYGQANTFFVPRGRQLDLKYAR